MGNPFGRSGYSVSKDRMRQAEDRLFNVPQGYSQGSSGYNVPMFQNNDYGVNPETGRSFTTRPEYSDYVKEGDANKAFQGIANAQRTAMQRGLAGGNRAAVSQFGRSGLGLGGAGGAMAQNRRMASRGMADIARQTGMDKLGYDTDMYKYDRGQSLQEESVLRGARAQDAAGRRADYGVGLQALLNQFNMDRLAQNDLFNQANQMYSTLRPSADRGSRGWVPQAGNVLGDIFEAPDKISLF